ncbi:MAG: hypothetical protein ACYDDT_12170 [Sulfuricella sp.]
MVSFTFNLRAGALHRSTLHCDGRWTERRARCSAA